MSATVSDIYLRDGATGQLVKAELLDCIESRHLDQHEQHWKPLLSGSEQHGHWDWRGKMNAYSGELRYQSFAIECREMTQGLMIVNTIKRGRITSQANLHLVYVEYLEAAPWNRSSHPGGAQFKGVGTVLMAAAIQLSISEDNCGRIGLHSLPQADEFYRRSGMVDLGPDPAYQNLRNSSAACSDSCQTRFMKL